MDGGYDDGYDDGFADDAEDREWQQRARLADERREAGELDERSDHPAFTLREAAGGGDEGLVLQGRPLNKLMQSGARVMEALRQIALRLHPLERVFDPEVRAVVLPGERGVAARRRLRANLSGPVRAERRPADSVAGGLAGERL